MRRIIYSPESKADIAAIGAYITDKASETTAARFLDRIRLGIEGMADYPGSRPLVPELGTDLRRLVVGNYLVFYRFDEDAVFIVRVLHGARNVTAKMFAG